VLQWLASLVIVWVIGLLDLHLLGARARLGIAVTHHLL